jgi:NADPH:quinone reductase-like Zn-dependent oxidoreductase
MISAHMKAAVYTKAKSGKVLEMKDLEQPVPKNNEVVIRVRAASVNPLDWRMKSQRPGVDVAGQVVAVGGTVTQFQARGCSALAKAPLPNTRVLPKPA